MYSTCCFEFVVLYEYKTQVYKPMIECILACVCVWGEGLRLDRFRQNNDGDVLHLTFTSDRHGLLRCCIALFDQYCRESRIKHIKCDDRSYIEMFFFKGAY